ncbi:MAG: hypothetical protein J6J33_06010 [Clostridia bacterium]|nr:hypothetical protein [Clostridia bacterium]
MNRLGKTIISLTSICIVAISAVLMYVFWPAITGTINDNKYYTAEDVQNSYDKGFDDGNKSETELSAEIIYYKTLVDDYETEVASLQGEINNLISVNSKNKLDIENLQNCIVQNELIITQNEQTIKSLTENKTNLEIEIENYLLEISNLENLILEKEEQISIYEESSSDLKSEIDDLKSDLNAYKSGYEELYSKYSDKKNECNSLKNDILLLQKTNDELRLLNASNVETIQVLNKNIEALNIQISNLNLEISNKNTRINDLILEISNLNISLDYYEKYFESLETDLQAVATFKYCGSVYNIQVLQKGSKIFLEEPTSTDYVIFNGWTVNDEPVDLSTYELTTNTLFVADVDYCHKVTFVDFYNNEYIQFVQDNNTVSLSNNFDLVITADDGYTYELVGCTVDGNTLINLSDYLITSNTIIYAKYVKVVTVNYLFNNTIIATSTGAFCGSTINCFEESDNLTPQEVFNLLEEKFIEVYNHYEYILTLFNDSVGLFLNENAFVSYLFTENIDLEIDAVAKKHTVIIDADGHKEYIYADSTGYVTLPDGDYIYRTSLSDSYLSYGSGARVFVSSNGLILYKGMFGVYSETVDLVTYVDSTPYIFNEEIPLNESSVVSFNLCVDGNIVSSLSGSDYCDLSAIVELQKAPYLYYSGTKQVVLTKHYVYYRLVINISNGVLNLRSVLDQNYTSRIDSSKILGDKDSAFSLIVNYNGWHRV